VNDPPQKTLTRRFPAEAHVRMTSTPAGVLGAPLERALLCSYDVETNAWQKQVVNLLMDGEPFAQGA
jgi:hypothetical protein